MVVVVWLSREVSRVEDFGVEQKGGPVQQEGCRSRVVVSIEKTWRQNDEGKRFEEGAYHLFLVLCEREHKVADREV